MAKSKAKLTIPKSKTSIVKVLAWLFVLGLVLSFEFVANPIGNAVGVPGTEIAEWSKFGLKVLSGLGMLWLGLAAMSLPILGYALIFGGMVILYYQARKFF